jgi:hypothetical protein
MFDLERPFHRLIHHFVERIFYGAGEGDELQFGIPALLGILSVPSAFFSITLLSKYSTLRLYLMHQRVDDVYVASIPDEHFFIVYSMVVTAAVVILRWDRLFPDRRDFDNLAVLPISSRQIFGASLCAILFLAGIFAVDINAAACLIFPLAATMRYTTLSPYGRFFMAHAASVILSSLFACFALLSALGITLLVVPQRYRRGASIAVRIVCALMVTALFSASFTIPRALFSGKMHPWFRYIPSGWFVDLQQGLLGRMPLFSGSALFGFEMTVGVFGLALAMYALTYRRQFRNIPEQNAVSPARGRDKPSTIRRVLDAAFLRSPFERGIYPFAFKTLSRSDGHCLLFGVGVGTGCLVAAQTLSEALAEPIRSDLDTRVLSIPLILAYFIVCSLRPLFDLPAERQANWIFKCLVDSRRHQSRAVATKVILMMIAPWLLFVALPLYAVMWSWNIALLHVGYVLLCSAALAELMLVGFRKIPFACMHTANKDRVLAMVVVGILGLLIFADGNSVFEKYLLEEPVRFLFVLPFFVALFCAIRAVERELSLDQRILIFEDRPAPAIQLLNLSR